MLRQLFAFALFLFSINVLSCELVVRVEDYAAQSYRDENMQWQGIDIELTKALLNQAGCTYRFVPVPWGRALKMLEMGKLDVMLSVSKTEKRTQFAHFIGPQRIEKIRIVSKANPSIILTSLSDVLNTPLPLGIQEGAYYGESFTRFTQSLGTPDKYFFKVSNNDTKLSLLTKGRIFGFLEEQLNIEYEIRHQLTPKDVFIHPVIVNQAPVYFAFSKASISKEQLNSIERAFNHLTFLGVFEQILLTSQN
ncbi:substrate-binding periplasmic protein [Pseudoalteromonas phenolica]|uniref:substrate-binding periplasmic protein n=1 Tax=Pseudoalteromonas phenolica TaxID=161398 RepID=UPI00110C1F0A|nr:transporter substrate-binding domain-containing protein [Pseudoalteromonas phenolica]TMO56406.1 ABC transporter substrate-binding protein [Pseudoalteromonas phenolica]